MQTFYMARINPARRRIEMRYAGYPCNLCDGESRYGTLQLLKSHFGDAKASAIRPDAGMMHESYNIHS